MLRNVQYNKLIIRNCVSNHIYKTKHACVNIRHILVSLKHDSHYLKSKQAQTSLSRMPCCECCLLL